MDFHYQRNIVITVHIKINPIRMNQTIMLAKCLNINRIITEKT